MPPLEAMISISGVSKLFGSVRAVDNVTLDIARNEFFAILGPSGSGKTTLLRLLGGFEIPNAGEIFLDREPVSEILPNQRPTNMVFQNYAIFPHLNVSENIAYGLLNKGMTKDQIHNTVDEMLDLIQLPGYGLRAAHQLSGGERQRVALAQALVCQPKALLLDEPLGALDKKLREEMQVELRQLQRTVGITFVFVTHDQEEALAVSDRIAVMDDGISQQLDTPDVIFRQPANRFVATFMGKMNLWEGTLADEDGQCLFRHESGLTILLPQNTTMNEGPVFLAMRPQTIKLSPDVLPGNTTAGSVIDRQFKGATVEFVVEVAGERITIVTHSDDPIAGKQPGEEVWVQIPGDKAIVLKD